MKRIEEMVKLFKSKSSFGFYVSIFLIVSCLIVIPLVDDLMIQIFLGAFILLILIRFIGILQERNRLNQVLKNYHRNPRKSLDAVNKQIQMVNARVKKASKRPEEGNVNQRKVYKHEQELLEYEQLKDAIKEQHPNL
ncbi:MAG: hypothetical protein ACVCEJ_06625 [Candidatus Izemoplasmataceae bacterium]